MKSSRPIVLIHGLWNSANIFNQLMFKLHKYNIDYFAPTLIHNYGMTSIVELTRKLNKLILQKYGDEREIDILGFSMGGIIGRCWINRYQGYKRTKRFISIGSPHRGTLTAQLIPNFPFKGISEMKKNSSLLKELSAYDDFLKDIECISFYTNWDLMVMPGWQAHLPLGEKVLLNILKHRNLIKSPKAVEKIFKEIIS